MITLFKDDIKKTKVLYDQDCETLLDAINSGEEALKKLLIPEEAEHIPHNPDRSRCAGVDSDTKTEKRICRCMLYNKADDNSKCKGEKCPLYSANYKVVGNEYCVVDYEIPGYYSQPGNHIGEIDLIITDGENEYATEVKPPEGNSETLLRMIAEILTYTIGYTEYKRAIAFFEDTPQEKEYLNMSEKIKEIIKLADVTVFEFKKEDKGYKICRL